MKAPITLKDIAEKAGVSITTVSRILNGSENAIPIREETRQRVFGIAAELGYRPNLLARGLRGSRSSLVGVIARDISDPFHIQVLKGVHSATSRRDHRMFLGYVDYRPDAAVAYGSMFEQSHADGIIIIGDMEGDEPAVDILTSQHRYVVGVTDRTERRQYPGVYADSVLGTHLALDHLWALGHRNIVCISDPRNHDGIKRAEVYEQYMSARGVEGRRVYMIPQEPQPSYAVGREIFATLSDASHPTAIYAASDTFAIYLMQAAFQAGVHIPQQISIVGYDNIDLTTDTVPPLTTIDQSGLSMGEIAANLLLDMIEGSRSSAEVEDIVFTPKLIVRQSTGTPPFSGQRSAKNK
jgi:DNA-binding LacI/PurR family transcriptional regulator